MMSEKTLYKIIDAGLLDVENIDMPRKVKIKKESTNLQAMRLIKISLMVDVTMTFKDLEKLILICL